MKKVILMAIAAIAVTGCFGQKISSDNVPSSVKQALLNSFPAASHVKWVKEITNFEAEFILDQEEVSALFSDSGSLLETETEIEVNQLPPAVLNYVSKNLNGKKIKEASKITTPSGVTTFEAEVGGKDYIFDQNGLLLKSE